MASRALKYPPKKFGRFAEDFKLPAALVVNKLDRERSSFERTVESVHERFGRAAVPVHLPSAPRKLSRHHRPDPHAVFHCYKAGGDGKGEERRFPTPEQRAATDAHEALVEMVAEGNDELMEEFFATGTLPVEHIVSGLQAGRARTAYLPGFVCAALVKISGADLC